jgi:hypothetical protein
VEETTLRFGLEWHGISYELVPLWATPLLVPLLEPDMPFEPPADPLGNANGSGLLPATGPASVGIRRGVLPKLLIDGLRPGLGGGCNGFVNFSEGSADVDFSSPASANASLTPAS